MWFDKGRWLEPIGQAIAFGAFGLQFFVVDPASNNALRGTIEYQRLLLEQQGKGDTAKPGTREEAQELVRAIDRQKSVLDQVEKDDAEKRAWRDWLFFTFALGALLTIAGKASSIKYAKK